MQSTNLPRLQVQYGVSTLNIKVAYFSLFKKKNCFQPTGGPKSTICPSGKQVAISICPAGLLVVPGDRARLYFQTWNYHPALPRTTDKKRDKQRFHGKPVTRTGSTYLVAPMLKNVEIRIYLWNNNCIGHLSCLLIMNHAPAPLTAAGETSTCNFQAPGATATTSSNGHEEVWAFNTCLWTNSKRGLNDMARKLTFQSSSMD